MTQSAQLSIGNVVIYISLVLLRQDVTEILFLSLHLCILSTPSSKRECSSVEGGKLSLALEKANRASQNYSCRLLKIPFYICKALSHSSNNSVKEARHLLLWLEFLQDFLKCHLIHLFLATFYKTAIIFCLAFQPLLFPCRLSLFTLKCLTPSGILYIYVL